MDFYGTQLHLMRVDLDNFWDNFGGKLNYGKTYNAEDKINALIKLASHIYVKRTKSLRRYRKRFMKNYKSTFNLPCFVCGSTCDHRHHIIPLKNGGINSKKNRLALCKNCHIKIHPWMKTLPLQGYGSNGDRPTDRPTEM